MDVQTGAEVLMIVRGGQWVLNQTMQSSRQTLEAIVKAEMCD